jgi:hypothetical protein
MYRCPAGTGHGHARRGRPVVALVASLVLRYVYLVPVDRGHHPSLVRLRSPRPAGRSWAVGSPANSAVRSRSWQGARGRPAEHDARYGDRRRTRSGARAATQDGHRDVSAAGREPRPPADRYTDAYPPADIYSGGIKRQRTPGFGGRPMSARAQGQSSRAAQSCVAASGAEQTRASCRTAGRQDGRRRGLRVGVSLLAQRARARGPEGEPGARARARRPSVAVRRPLAPTRSTAPGGPARAAAGQVAVAAAVSSPASRSLARWQLAELHAWPRAAGGPAAKRLACKPIANWLIAQKKSRSIADAAAFLFHSPGTILSARQKR